MVVTRWRTGVRFGIGDPDGHRSSSWTVKGGRDSSIYVLSRDVGHAIKASLHPRDESRPGGEWRVALVGDNARVTPEVADRLVGRVIEVWDSELCRLGQGVPLRQGFAVLLGRFSMGRHPESSDSDELDAYRRRLGKVDWIDMPPADHAWQFTVLVTDPGIALKGTPGRRAMKALPVGAFVLPNGSDVWIVRHLVPISDETRDMVTKAANIVIDRLGMPEAHSIYRAHLPTISEQLRSFVEVAVTIRDPDPSLPS